MGFYAESFGTALQLIAEGDASLRGVVTTSLFTAVGAVALAALVAVPGGVASGLADFRGKAALRHGLNALMALPTVVVGLVLYGLLSRRGLLGDFGLLYTPLAMTLGQAVLVLPLVWNLVLQAVEDGDPRLAFTCRVLGARGWQRALIVAHESRHRILAALVLGFGRAIGEVGVAMMLGGNIDGLTRTMTTAIALETSKGEFALALALGLVLLAVALGVNLALGLLEARRR